MKLHYVCLCHAGSLSYRSLRQCRNSHNARWHLTVFTMRPLTMHFHMQVKTFGRGQTPSDRAGQPAELAPPFVFLANTAGVPMLWVLLWL